MMMDKYAIAVLIVQLFVVIGWRIDSVTNRFRKTPKQQRDLRDRYWIVDPIETRVVRKTPLPGTTGDIEPEHFVVPHNMGINGQLYREGDLIDGYEDIMDIPEVHHALLTGDVSQLLRLADGEERRGE